VKQRSARQRATDWVYAHVFAPAGALLLRLLCLTWRWQFSGLEHLEPFWKGGKPVIICCWHGRLIMLPYTWERHGGGDVFVLMGLNRNGELITRVVSRFNMKAIRGSSRTGGKEARDEMVRLVKERPFTTIAVTPDGPHGPPMVMKPGTVQVSRDAGVPVLWASAAASSCVLAPTWDRFVVPLPFSRVHVRFSAPLEPAAWAAQPFEAYVAAIERLGHAERDAVDALVAGR
jgi:lysophospholipid acyltransferase (LPLAT)-like uncharacterized protein